MKHGNYGSCILSNLLEVSQIMHFYFNTMHKSMSNFACKHEIKKISLTDIRLGLHFPRYIVDEILSFVNDEVHY